MPPPRSPRRRPPWWPEDEPWPPRGRVFPGRRFVRRMILFGISIFAFFAILNVVTWIIFRRGHEGGGDYNGPPGFFVIFLIVVIAAGIFFARRAVRSVASPIGDAMDAVERLAAGDYSTRVEVDGSRDSRELARAINGLAGRLEALDAERRNLVADVSHELRTPLSVIRGNIEGMTDGVYPLDTSRLQVLLDEVDVIARLVEDFQTISSVAAGTLRLHREPVDLAALVASTTSAFSATAESAGITLSATTDAIPEMSIDPVRIREVIENLVANAIRHTPPGGSVTVTLAASDGGARIAVRDSGSGIAPDDLPHIFDRYHKSADSSGLGLGLPIARRLAEAHGGTLAAASTPGAGSTFTLRLPPTPP